MKYKLLILFLFLTSFLFAQQNLVPNPSFEIYSICPDHLNQIQYAQNWEPYTVSTDYYNECADNAVSVPINFCGYQNAFDGNAYAGLIIAHGGGSTNNYREYIGCTLLDSLVINQKYFLSFKVSPSNYNLNFANNIGLLFSNKSYLNFGPNWPYDSIFIKNYSHLHSNSVITDTLNWTIISGSFIADSSYKYLIIGNFYDDTHTTVINTGYYVSSAYYYIDDLCVSTDSLLCNSTYSVNQNSISKINVKCYPNPAQTELNIDYNLKSESYFELYDILGAKRKVVLLDYISNYKKIDLSELNSGLYFFTVLDKYCNILKSGKLNIQK